MCGISAVRVQGDVNEANQIYWKLLKASDIRGQDGTGYAILKESGELYTFRSDTRARDINEFRTLEVGDMCIGQNRLSVFGMDRKNLQPIKIGDLILIHNGNLYAGFEKIFEENGWDQKLEVDTELILRMIYERFTSMAIQPVFTFESISHSMVTSICDTRSSLKGNFACVLLHKSSGMMFAFAKYKPLYHMIYNQNDYFFSTINIAEKVFPMDRSTIERESQIVRNNMVISLNQVKIP
jgi:glutamine phosphoribosylpyrophosphate amidotransferase